MKQGCVGTVPGGHKDHHHMHKALQQLHSGAVACLEDPIIPSNLRTKLCWILRQAYCKMPRMKTHWLRGHQYF